MNLKDEIKRLCQECACIKPGNKCVFCPDEQPSCRYYRNGQLAELRCRYFETHVLPADRQLEEAYWQAVNNEKDVRIANSACTRCGKTIRKRSNAHKYCEDCASVSKRTAQRAYMQRRRKNASSVEK